MDVMLQKRCAKFIYVVPEGLRELMSDISREVIRSQPKYIYTFIADYLDALMITRENARVAARLVDSIVRIGVTTVELLEKTGMTREEADRMATIIQSAFKQYMASRRASAVPYYDDSLELEEEQDMVSNILDEFGDLEHEDIAAEIIQRAFKMFKERQKHEKEMLSGMIDWRVAARSAIYLYRKSGVTNEEANRAATLIKAAYKGYYTRRVMKRLLEEGSLLYEDEGAQYQGEDVLGTEEEVIYEDTTVGISQRYNWRDEIPDDNESTAATSDDGMTSTDVADSIINSMLKIIPSESEPDTTGTDNWTEGLETDQKLVEGLESEVGEFMEMHEETPFESEHTTTTAVASQAGEPVTESSEGHDGDTGEKTEFVEGSGGPEVAGTTTNEETDYSETVTDTEITMEGTEEAE